MKSNEYIPGDIDHNVKVAVQVMREIYWRNIIEPNDAVRFTDAEEIIIAAILHHKFDVVRKEE